MFDGSLAAKRSSLKRKQWVYRGEGNANLVLALPQDRTILRLRKSECLTEGEAETIWREVDFCRNVIRPLFGERFVHVPHVVRLDEQELQKLNETLRPFRPVYREHKGLHNKYATILPDFTLLPNDIEENVSNEPIFSIEIKPKQGHAPVCDRKLPRCTFCLNQYLKLENGSVGKISQYCPLDLFSGKRDRMKCAIRNLLATPQNNLKIFKNGELIYLDNSSTAVLQNILEEWFDTMTDLQRLIGKLEDLVINALTRNLKSNETYSENVLNSELFTSLKQSYLHEINNTKVPSCVNNNEYDVQPNKLNKQTENNNLSQFPTQCNNFTEQHYLIGTSEKKYLGVNSSQDIHNTNLFHFKSNSHQDLLKMAEKLLPGPPCDWNRELLPGKCILNRLLNIQKLNAIGSDELYKYYETLQQKTEFYLKTDNSVTSLSPILAYLLAISANDCSIMISFRKQNRENIRSKENCIDIEDTSFVFNISVLDLDLKPVSCIEKHRVRDLRAVSSCIRTLQPS